jgi:hypothetical protein
VKRLIIVFACLFFYMVSFSQDSFEGTVIYETELSGPAASVLRGMLPDIYKFEFKGRDVRVELIGGLLGSMFWPVISSLDSNKAYMIDEDNKTAYLFSTYQYTRPRFVPKQIEDAVTEMKILGYKCQLYKVVIPSNIGNTTVNVWTTTDLLMVIPDNNPLSKSLSFPGIEGFPLLVESFVEHQSSSFKFVVKVKSIKPQSFDSSLFRIPENYSLKLFDELQYGGFE